MPISGSLSASRLPPHKKHAALSSGYFSLHCEHDFMGRPLPSSPDRLPEERPSGGRPGIAPNRQLFPALPWYNEAERIPFHVPVERRQPLKIEVPDQKQETLRFGRVGLIVTAGFAIGILWPRVAGFKLVPSVPSQPADSSGSADLTGAPADPKSGAGPANSAAAAEVEPPPQAAPPNTDRLQISEPQFVVCKAKGKKKKDDCDHIDFDRLARPHIQAL